MAGHNFFINKNLGGFLWVTFVHVVDTNHHLQVVVYVHIVHIKNIFILHNMGGNTSVNFVGISHLQLQVEVVVKAHTVDTSIFNFIIVQPLPIRQLAGRCTQLVGAIKYI